MTEFETKGFVLVRGFLEKQAAETVSRYMEFALNRGDMPIVRADAVAATHSRYADPLTETILFNSLGELEEITGKQLYPTYSYSRVYVKGDKLKPHTDRESCEVSVSVQVGTKGAAWPIWMKAPGKEPMSFTLGVGDAVVYKGCEVTHWRETAVDTEVTAQFMLHYVDKNGPYTAFKWDKRPALGMPAITRRA